jgi:hypothetical protein
VTDDEVEQGFHGVGWGWVGQWNLSRASAASQPCCSRD